MIRLRIRTLPVVQAIALLVAAIIIAVTFVVDLAALLLTRVKSEEEGAAQASRAISGG